MTNLTKIPNPFDRSKREEIPLVVTKNTSLKSVMNSHFAGMDVIVSINGKIIAKEDWSGTVISHYDHIVVTPRLTGGGDDKGILGIVLMIALVAFGVPYLAGNVLMLEAGTTPYLIASMVIVAAGGMLISSIMSPEPPKTNLSGEQASPTFGWNPQTTQAQGSPVPVYYGKMRSYGNVVTAFTENGEDSNQILNTLISLSGGPVEGMSDFRINDQPIENFTDVNVETRIGELEQSLIENFNDTKLQLQFNSVVNYDDPAELQTQNVNFDELEIDISFPQGLYYANDEGSMSTHSVEFKIEYKKEDQDWSAAQTLIQTKVSGNKTSALRRTYKAKNLEASKYDVRVTRISQEQTSSRYGDKMIVTAIKEVQIDDFEYPRTAMVGIKALATDQLSGSLRFSCILEGKLVRIYDGENWSIGWSDNPAWVCWDILTQPVIKNDRTLARNPDGTIRYDAIPAQRLDLAKFAQWANWCDQLVPDGKGGQEKRCTCNICFDAEDTLWANALRVFAAGRAEPIWHGSSLSLWIDKPDEPCALVCEDNVIAGTYEEVYLKMADRVNELEVEFLDAESDYKRTPLSVVSLSDPIANNSATVQLAGITKASQAWRHAMYHLYQNQYLTRVATFEMDVEALGFTVGDVIHIQRNMPRFSSGGRILGVNGRNLLLDQQVSLAPNKQYELHLRYRNEVEGDMPKRSVHAIVNEPGVTDEVTVGADFEIDPSLYDSYTLGEQNQVVEPWRIKGLSKREDLTVQIEALEYNADIYNVDTDEPQLPVPSYKPAEADQLYVEDLTLEEVAEVAEDGILNRHIRVSYTKPVGVNWQRAEIYYKPSGTNHWALAGSTTSDEYLLAPVVAATTYNIKVLSVDNFEFRTNWENSPTANITTGAQGTFTGTNLIAVVSGLEVESFTDNVKIVWDDITQAGGDYLKNLWLRDYQVVVKDSLNNVRRTEYVNYPEYSYTKAMNIVDGVARSLKFEIRPRDVDLRVSTGAATVEAINLAPTALSEILGVGEGQGFNVRWLPAADSDLKGYVIEASQDVQTLEEVYDGPNTVGSVSVLAEQTGTWYYRAAAYDELGKVDLNWSDISTLNVTGSLSKFTSFIFRRLATQPPTPTGDSPANWSDTPPANDGNPLWMSNAVKNIDGSLDGAWSEPARMTGEDGEAGDPGNPGASIIWKGESAVAPASPEENWAYRNTQDSRVYIYNGDAWELMVMDGSSGTPGAAGNNVFITYHSNSLSSEPPAPTGDGTTGGWTTTPTAASNWMSQLIAVDVASGAWGSPIAITGVDGANGTNGISIDWRGSFTSAPADPEQGWAYYNTVDKKGYTYNGSAWALMVQDGSDGTNGTNGINGGDGQGLYITYHDNPIATQPTDPPAGDGTGGGWHTNSTAAVNWMSQKVASSAAEGTWGTPILIAGADGANGINGTNGINGLSIAWQGELASAPASPQENWVYKNTNDSIAYIYNGSSWEVMIYDGDDGAAGTHGNSVFVAYHSNPVNTSPSAPTGEGTTGGWSSSSSGSTNWMSQKVALTITAGSWGTPILVAGLDGIDAPQMEVRYCDTVNGTYGAYEDGDVYMQISTDGGSTWSQAMRIKGEQAAAVEVNFSVPQLTEIDFSNDSPSTGRIAWSAGVIKWKGVDYAISAGDTANPYIYFNPAIPASLQSTTDATLFTSNVALWVVCTNLGGDAHQSSAHKVLHGGLIQANTITADQLSTAELITLAAQIKDAIITNAHIQNASITDAKIASLSADKINAGTLSADRIVGGHIQADTIDANTINGMHIKELASRSSIKSWSGTTFGSNADVYISQVTQISHAQQDIIATGTMYFNSYSSAAWARITLELYYGSIKWSSTTITETIDESTIGWNFGPIRPTLAGIPLNTNFTVRLHVETNAGVTTTSNTSGSFYRGVVGNTPVLKG